MSDRSQRPLAWLIAALMVTAVAAAPTVAQKADPSAEGVFEVAGLNADTVDGRHAIGATANKAARAYKLVATNRYGQLPSNIIRPRWRELKGVPAGFRDGIDDVGVWKVTISTFWNDSEWLAQDTGDTWVGCPAGTKVVGGGFGQPEYDVVITDSLPYDNGWQVYGENRGTLARDVDAYVLCLSTNPSSGLASKGNIRPASKAK